MEENHGEYGGMGGQIDKGGSRETMGDIEMERK